MKTIPSRDSLFSNQDAVHREELVRSFNTALLSSRNRKVEEISAEICELVDSPAFQAMLDAVAQLSRQLNIPSREAAERVIGTFRKLDELWESYLIQEGIEQLKGGR